MACENATAVMMTCHQRYRNISEQAMELCYLTECFIPQTLPGRTLVPMTACYMTIFIFGLFGNLCTCLVIAKHPSLQSNTSKYLMNLAIADLITILAGIPFEIYMLWQQYPWQPPDFACNLRAWALETTSYVSVLTILTFSFERYFVICHSLLARKYCSYDTYLPYVFCGLWIVAGASAVPYGIYHRADYVFKDWDVEPEYGPLKQSKMCMLALAFDPSLMDTFNILFHVSALIYFVLPLLLLICLYARVGFVARHTRRIVRKYSENSTDLKSGKVLKILVSVVVVFFSCYAPYQIQRLIFFYIDDSALHEQINEYLYIISGILFYLSCILNPILYNLISSKYRQAFRDILYWSVGKPTPRPRTYTNTSSRQCLLQKNSNKVVSTPAPCRKETDTFVAL